MVTVGINIVNFGRGAELATVRENFLRAEASGFDLAMVSDHVAVTADVDRAYPHPFLEAFTLLSWASAATSRIMLGTTVAVLPYRHPLLVAAMTETVERLSGRAVVLGVGAGWAAGEYRALGLDFARRGPTTDDYLAALAARRIGADHDGPFASFRDVRSGHFKAPIWVGGNSAAAISRAIRHGQAWHPLDVTLARVRDVGVPALRGQPVGIAPRVKLRVNQTPVSRDERLLGEGDWAQIESDLSDVVALGASHVILDPDVPDVRAGADPWPRLERAQKFLRSLP